MAAGNGKDIAKNGISRLKILPSINKRLYPIFGEIGSIIPIFKRI